MELAVDKVPAAPGTASSLAPGFRFHPTDEELVRYYLRRKVCGKPFRFDAISDVDVYKVEPWDLPGLSRLKSRDLEWYFFSVLDKKYGNGSRTNRATDRGYWKTTGKDRAVYHRSQLVGMKKTLVYHSGRAPKGERTNWVMHEYRLIDQELENAGIVQDAFVLCRIFRKSGSGPKNGEQYGAPFVEEEWEDDDLVTVPKQECAEEFPVDYDDDVYLDMNDLEQILGSDMPEKDESLPLDLSQGENINYADVSEEMINDHQKLLVGVSEEPAADNAGPKLFDLPNGMDPTSVKHEYIGESSNTTNFDMDYLLDEPYFDASTGDFQLDERSFFEADDLKNTKETDPCLDMFDEYTSFFNPPTDNLQYAFDSLENENILAESSENVNKGNQASEASQGDHVAFSSKQERSDFATEGTHQAREANKQLFEEQTDNVALSSKQEHPDLSKDIGYPFLKKASCRLGSIPAPSAFASEFPSKYLASASQSSGSVRVTTGMIQIRNVSFSGSEVDWSLGKHGQVNIVLSFGLGQNNTKVVGPAEPRGWFYCVFLWILVLSLSFKIGTLVCPRSFMS